MKLSGSPPKRGIECSINLVPGTQLINLPLNQRDRNELRELYCQLLVLWMKKFIWPNSSPWGAPILFTEKKDGTPYFVSIIENSTMITTNKWCLLPHVNNLFNQLSGPAVFFKIHLNSSYHQMWVWVKDMLVMTFCYWYSRFKFWVMPYGLINALTILSDLMKKKIWTYHRPICSYPHRRHTGVLEELLRPRLQHVMETLRQHILYAKFKKCSFWMDHTSFLGHIVSGEGVSIDLVMIDNIINMGQLVNIEDVYRFFRPVGHSRRFIQDLSRISAPLKSLVKKGSTSTGIPNVKEAF